MRHVSATDARIHLGELLTAVAKHGETIVIEQRGVAVAELRRPDAATAKRSDANLVAEPWQAWWQLSATDGDAADYRTLLEESYDR